MTEKKKPTVIYFTPFTKSVVMSENWFVLYPDPDDRINLPGEATFKALVNGRAAFETLHEKISRAEKSVDIAIWGFQPSMFFKRGGETGKGDEEILRIGDLLAKKITENPDFKVRILVWSIWKDVQTLVEENVGYKPDGVASGAGNISLEQKLYDRYWYMAVKGEFHTYYENLLNALWETCAETESVLGELPEFCKQMESAPGELPEFRTGPELRKQFLTEYKYLLALSKSPHRKNLQYKNRKIKKENQTLPPELPFIKHMLLHYAATHHQKSVLIDYENPSKAVGFILEHNMLDNYWDDDEHFYQTQPNLPHVHKNVRTPLQDVSCMVGGEALWFINRNFCQGWDRKSNRLYGDKSQRDEQLLRAQRESIKKDQFPVRSKLGTPLKAQVLRTYDQDYDGEYAGEKEGGYIKDIKRMYLQNITKTTSYLYTENQYFRWPELVDAFIDHWQTMKKAGRADNHPLQWFVVTNSSSEGMGKGVEDTYRMLEKLGNPHLMPKIMRNKTMPTLSNEEISVIAQKGDSGEDISAEMAEMKKRTEPYYPENDSNDEKLMAFLKTKLSQTAGIKCHICTLGAQVKDAQDLALAKAALPGAEKYFYGNNYRPKYKNRKEEKEDKNPSRETYIHSKVSIIDDVFTFIGSANLNDRSMNADTELGIITECKKTAQKLRQDLWRLHTQKDVGSPENPVDISFYEKAEKVFNIWDEIIRSNSKGEFIDRPLRLFIYRGAVSINWD